MQFSMISVKPMSLPPIVTETTLVPALGALNCGGVGPGGALRVVVSRAQTAEWIQRLVRDQRPGGVGVAERGVGGRVRGGGPDDAEDRDHDRYQGNGAPPRRPGPGGYVHELLLPNTRWSLPPVIPWDEYYSKAFGSK